MDKLAIFSEVFETTFTDYEGECRCGRHFYDSELFALYIEDEDESDGLYVPPAGSTELDYRVSYLKFENNDYVIDCDCWHKRAKKVMGFLDTHDVQIANYLNSIRAEKIRDAEKVNVIRILSHTAEEDIKNGR